MGPVRRRSWLRGGGRVLLVGEELEACFFNDRIFGRKRALAFVRRRQLLGFDFAGFDVGLIEGVDADESSRRPRLRFPSGRIPGRGCRCRRRRCARQAARLFRARRLWRPAPRRARIPGEGRRRCGRCRKRRARRVSSRSTGMMPLPSLPVDSAISCSSHAPRSRNAGRGDERDFVAAQVGGGAEDDAEHHAGILFHGSGRRRRPRPSALVRCEKLAGVEAHGRGGNHAEVRERGVAPADGGQSVKDVAEAVALGDQLHLRAGIGDGDEVAARFVAAHRLLHALEEILLVDVGFERAAGFAGNDEERSGEVELLFDAAICAGSVESRMCRRGKPGACGKVSASTSGQRLDPPMPSSRMSEKPTALDFVRERLQLGCVGELIVGDAEPAQPLGFVFAGPERGVLLPEPAYFSRCPPVVKVFFYRGIEIGRKRRGLCVDFGIDLRVHLIALYSFRLRPAACRRRRQTALRRRRSACRSRLS